MKQSVTLDELDREFKKLCEGVPEKVIDKILDDTDIPDGMTIGEYFRELIRKLRRYRNRNGIAEPATW